jgi:hypothetical protein
VVCIVTTELWRFISQSLFDVLWEVRFTSKITIRFMLVVNYKFVSFLFTSDRGSIAACTHTSSECQH